MDLTKIVLILFYVVMILFISLMIMDTKNSSMFLVLYVLMLIFYSYSLGNFLGRDKEMSACFHEKELLLDAEMARVKAINRHIKYTIKRQIYEYKGKKYILLDIVKLKPTFKGDNRGWVKAVVYAPLDRLFETYVREENEFFRRFKRVK